MQPTDGKPSGCAAPICCFAFRRTPVRQERGAKMHAGKRNDKQGQKKIYLRQKSVFVPVSDEVFHEYYRPVWAHMKRMQYHGRCYCPKSRIWECDADCELCRHARKGDISSLDEIRMNADGDTCTLADTMMDNTVDVESMVVDVALMDALSAKVKELEPDLQDIFNLLLEEKTEREIAQTLGYKSQTSVNRKRKKLGRILSKALSEFFA